MSEKKHVAVVGLGPMGATMAETFLKAGHPVTVWNRTASKADALVAQGATLAPSAAAAVAAADLTVISQTDYKAMYASFGDPGDALRGRVLVNLSSGSPAELREAAIWAERHGATLLTGGIMVPPPGIGQPGAYVHYSGPEEALDEHRATLAVLAEPVHQGADHGLAMAFYQAELYVFWSTLTAYMHSVGMLTGYGAKPGALRRFTAKMLTDLAGDGPMGFVGHLTREIETGEYEYAENTLRMQAVGMDHIVETSEDAGVDTTVPKALRDLFWRPVHEIGEETGLGSVYEAIRKPQG
ncbi:NAD(P)-dependent oxidoreductase [Actinomadura kijaniata]|uniref:NAD(P)-dependent oxidoreductase n=1 Tax=Actinomadura kijaniata TaxID=46161 RepID=UPI00082FC8A7|nr:NAD(P)-binding domain-containing protein [Actinomadura kijaniata]